MIVVDASAIADALTQHDLIETRYDAAYIVLA